MADKYLAIQNFKYGLESRKSELITQPGALAQLINGHINSGGECEQRLTFYALGSLQPANTFGLQDTDTGVMVFGSVANPGALPNGVVYQQLTHPFNAALAMTAVVFSCNYQGKAFVIATFQGDTHTYFYYNGTLVASSANGIIFGPQSNTLLSTELAAQVNALNQWVGTANTPTNGDTLVGSPLNSTFIPTITKNSTNGLLGAIETDPSGSAGTPAKAAVAIFLISGTNPGGSWAVSAPANSDGTGTADLTGGNIALVGVDLTATAAAIVTAINNRTYIHGYSASSNAANITVVAPIAWGNVTFNLTVTPTGGNAGTGAGSSSITASANPNFVQQTKVVHSGGATCQGSTTIQVSGATGALTYTWSELTSPPSGITKTPSGPNCTFSISLSINQSASGTFKCHVSDAGTGTTADVQVSVYFSVESLN